MYFVFLNPRKKSQQKHHWEFLDRGWDAGDVQHQVTVTVVLTEIICFAKLRRKMCFVKDAAKQRDSWRI